MTNGAVLLTGATGFLGAVLADALLARGDRVVALVRAPDADAAERRMDAALAQLHGEGVAVPGRDRLRAVPGDLVAPRLGLARAARERLVDEVAAVVHCGASITFDLPLDEARAVNVGGTAEVLELVSALRAAPRLVHVSTAFVAGRHEGVAGELTPPPLDVAFRNTYERTKAEAERLVAASGIPAAIARPSIVMGEAGSGWTSAFNVLYWPLQAFSRGLLDELPADPDGVVDTIPVDAVAAGVLELLADPEEPTGAFALAAGPHAITVRELAQVASHLLDRPAPRFTAAGGDALQAAGGQGAVYVPYFDVATRFATDRGAALLARAGVDVPRLPEHLPALLHHARAARWGRRARTRAQARGDLPAAAERAAA
ncbi:SDR family oxidoreductase [Conexibacter sp. SYSU D00693]|uniref:SDR family oxidoreductase n=1 Tax=Conexibacter sp. SYSU D00693 TaxID=2812560 RepID=UPI00196B8E74|nr:SDR family oxidoreductase [Conexibacter sp. SYSU D00693]